MVNHFVTVAVFFAGLVILCEGAFSTIARHNLRGKRSPFDFGLANLIQMADGEKRSPFMMAGLDDLLQAQQKRSLFGLSVEDLLRKSRSQKRSPFGLMSPQDLAQLAKQKRSPFGFSLSDVMKTKQNADRNM